MRLTDSDKTNIETGVAAFEQATGAQAVVSVVDRCDSYPEVPWRAFSLGVVLSALLVWAVPISGAVIYHSTTLVLVVVLATGVIASLLTIIVPVTGRWLLPRQRREMEVRQYAQALFLTREMFATHERCTVLVLLGLYERHAVILADSGLVERLPANRIKAMTEQLNSDLGAGAMTGAVLTVLGKLQTALQGPGAKATNNEIADSVISERGH